MFVKCSLIVIAVLAASLSIAHIAPQSPSNQDMLIERNSPIMPEPATAMLLAFAGLIVLKRRRRIAVRNACQTQFHAP